MEEKIREKETETHGGGTMKGDYINQMQLNQLKFNYNRRSTTDKTYQETSGGILHVLGFGECWGVD